MSEPILPGATLGVLGNGQLGRMFAIAAKQMGYRVHTLGPGDDSPTGQVADNAFVADYGDLDRIRAFAQSVQVVTFEFENVPFASAQEAERFAPVRPGGQVLHTTQNRWREKSFLQQGGFPVTPFAPVRSEQDAVHALAGFGGTGVLKTSGFGYDGKGQQIVRTVEQAASAFHALYPPSANPTEGKMPPLIMEAFIPYTCEISVVAARGANADFAHYGAALNHHEHHILSTTTAPTPENIVSASVQKEAVEIARGVLDALNVVGVLCVEFFVREGGSLLINELAPRPHNSGHWTIEGCAASQFEQQVRAVCHLPLGDTTLCRPSAMANLLGELWANGTPDWQAALALPDVHLHLYGKAEAKPGRKMGHLTALAQSPEEAQARVLEARTRLVRSYL